MSTVKQTMKATTANQNHHLSNCSSVRTFQNLFQSLSRKSEGEADFSRIDWAVVKIMLKKGYSPRDIAIGFRNGSLNIEVRKAGHIEDYIIRTIDKASKY